MEKTNCRDPQPQSFPSRTYATRHERTGVNGVLCTANEMRELNEEDVDEEDQEAEDTHGGRYLRPCVRCVCVSPQWRLCRTGEAADATIEASDKILTLGCHRHLSRSFWLKFENKAKWKFVSRTFGTCVFDSQG